MTVNLNDGKWHNVSIRNGLILVDNLPTDELELFEDSNGWGVRVKEKKC